MSKSTVYTLKILIESIKDSAIMKNKLYGKELSKLVQMKDFRMDRFTKDVGDSNKHTQCVISYVKRIFVHKYSIILSNFYALFNSGNYAIGVSLLNLLFHVGRHDTETAKVIGIPKELIQLELAIRKSYEGYR